MYRFVCCPVKRIHITVDVQVDDEKFEILFIGLRSDERKTVRVRIVSY